MDIIAYAIARKALRKIEEIEKITVKKVDILPEIGEPNIIYLVPKKASPNNTYDEYMWIEEAWEKIGSTDIDFEDYYTKEDTDNLLEEKVDKEEGKKLTSNDFSNDYKNKLESIEEGAQVNKPVDSVFNSLSYNAQSGIAVQQAIDNIKDLHCIHSTYDLGVIKGGTFVWLGHKVDETFNYKDFSREDKSIILNDGDIWAYDWMDYGNNDKRYIFSKIGNILAQNKLTIFTSVNDFSKSVELPGLCIWLGDDNTVFSYRDTDDHRFYSVTFFKGEIWRINRTQLPMIGPSYKFYKIYGSPVTEEDNLILNCN